MSVGFVRLYRRDWSPEQVRRRVDSLAAAGMVLGHLRTGRITAISGERETCGEQVEMDREGLLAAMDRLVVDRWGTSDTELDDIITGGSARVTVTPELMVLRPEIARRNFEPGDLVPFGGFLAHDADGILALAN